MTISIKRSSGRTVSPTPKQGHGQRAAFEAKRAACGCGGPLPPLYVYPTPVAVTTRKRRAVGAFAAV